MKKVTLPDFDDMLSLATSIGSIKTELMIAEGEHEELKAHITEFVLANEVYWADKKAPSNAHIKDTFHIIGYDEDTGRKLKEYNNRIATLTGKLKTQENTFRILESMIDVWRTQSANERYDT